MKKYIFGVLIFLSVIAATGFILTKKTTAPSAIAPASTSNSTDTISASAIATHDSKTDCWTIINGSVYDITKYVSEHPGGDVIEQACGTDATNLFNNRDGSGDSHSPTADVILAKYKIGQLTK